MSTVKLLILVSHCRRIIESFCLAGPIRRGQLCDYGNARGPDDQRFLSDKVLPPDQMAYNRTDLEKRLDTFAKLRTTISHITTVDYFCRLHGLYLPWQFNFNLVFV